MQHSSPNRETGECGHILPWSFAKSGFSISACTLSQLFSVRKSIYAICSKRKDKSMFLEQVHFVWEQYISLDLTHLTDWAPLLSMLLALTPLQTLENASMNFLVIVLSNAFVHALDNHLVVGITSKIFTAKNIIRIMLRRHDAFSADSSIGLFLIMLLRMILRKLVWPP